MNYTAIEDAYGTPFGKRVPVNQVRKDVKETPLETNKEVASNVKGIVDSLKDSLPLDENKTTENFRMESPFPMRRRVQQQEAVRESFSSSQPAGVYDNEQHEKLSRILRLIEQNRTGYERPATQDMVLYIFTGIFFLFTFDTFVELGRSMRR